MTYLTNPTGRQSFSSVESGLAGWGKIDDPTVRRLIVGDTIPWLVAHCGPVVGVYTPPGRQYLAVQFRDVFYVGLYIAPGFMDLGDLSGTSPASVTQADMKKHGFHWSTDSESGGWRRAFPNHITFTKQAGAPISTVMCDRCFVHKPAAMVVDGVCGDCR